MSVAIKVRQIREQAGFSQEGLAHLSGISRGYISRIERGIANPTAKILEQIARACEVHSSEFLGQTSARYQLLKHISDEHELLHDKLQAVLDAGGYEAGVVTAAIEYCYQIVLDSRKQKLQPMAAKKASTLPYRARSPRREA